MTGDVSRSYKWSVVDLWVDEFSRTFFEVLFFLFVWLLKDNIFLRFW
jgi:hypothetical protein